MILPVRIPFQAKTTVKIERSLPGAGKILVKPGDEVTPEEVLGEAEVSGGFRKINLGQILGIRDLGKSLIKKTGEVIYKGEPLARVKKMLGLRSSVYLSPVDGVIEEVADGEVTIRFVPGEFKLLAGFGGVVESVEEGKSVTITSSVTRIRGVVGVGRERFGTIKVVGKAGEFLLPQHLDSSSVGKIVVGGAIVTADTIEKALAIGVKGLVTGGINFHETMGWSEGSDIGLSIVALEGYGFHPLSSLVFDEVAKYDGQYGSISGERAEVLIAGSAVVKEKPVPPWREVQVGDLVRVVAGSDLGAYGEVAKLPREKSVLPSGIASELVTIKVGSEELQAPWQNLEVTGFKND